MAKRRHSDAAIVHVQQAEKPTREQNSVRGKCTSPPFSLLVLGHGIDGDEAAVLFMVC